MASYVPVVWEAAVVGRRQMLRTSLVGALLLALGGCATQDPGGAARAGGGNTKAASVPSNYRQLVARHIAAKTDLSKVSKAEISGPGEWSGRSTPRGPLRAPGTSPRDCCSR